MKVITNIILFGATIVGGALLEYKYQLVEKSMAKYQDLKGQVQQEIERRKDSKKAEEGSNK